MSLLHPIRSQYEGLIKAFGDKRFISLKNAAIAMGIKEDSVAKSLVKMEQKGLFDDAVPYVEAGFSMVVRDRQNAPYALTAGATERICRLLSRAMLTLPEYKNYLNLSRGRGARVGKAFMTFAEGMMSGRRAAENFRNSARWLFDESEPEKKQEADPSEVMEKLSRYAEELHTYVMDHPDNVYTEELRNWLTSLTRTLDTWLTGVRALYSSDQAPEAVRIAMNRLGTKYLDDFPQMLEVAKKVPVASSSLEEVQNALLDTMAYLNTVDDEITDFRVRAAVIRLQSLLGGINGLYSRSEDNYSRSDARSLRNSYLPMLRSLMEKYMSYERSLKYGRQVNYSPEETVRVLENDLPRALDKIRTDLQKTEAYEMEDEATALRQKLEMDGLI